MFKFFVLILTTMLVFGMVDAKKKREHKAIRFAHFAPTVVYQDGSDVSHNAVSHYPSKYNGGYTTITTTTTAETCRYWCRTPEGSIYCCEEGNESASLVGEKDGVCPTVRPYCPPVRSGAPPATCSNDGSCGGDDKCCYDRCLDEHVCKPPL